MDNSLNNKSRAAISLDTCNILHVDDEKNFLELTELYLMRLSKKRWKIDHLDNSAFVLDKVKENNYDLIIVDYQMPKKDGLDVLKEIRMYDSKLPVIMLTGKSREEIAIQALNYGANHYIRKGGDADSMYHDLYATIVTIVKRSKLEQALLKSQQELIKSQAHYKTIFENTGTATVLVEEDTTISLANSRFAKLAGYTKEEIEGKMSWQDFVTEEYLESMTKYHYQRRINNTIPTEYEFDFVDREGNIKNVHLTIDMIPGTKKSIASLTDITYLKNQEKEIRRQEKSYRTLIEHLPIGVVISDKEGNVLHINSKILEIFRTKRDVFLNELNTEDYYVDISEREEYVQRLMKEGKVKDFQCRFKRVSDGTDFLGSINSIVEQQGDQIRIISTLIDIEED